MSKPRLVYVGEPVCAYCGDSFEGAYLHRRNADWHSGCWLQMSNDKYELEELRGVAAQVVSAVFTGADMLERHCSTCTMWWDAGEGAYRHHHECPLLALQTVLQTNDVDGQAIPASSKDDAARPNG